MIAFLSSRVAFSYEVPMKLWSVSTNRTLTRNAEYDRAEEYPMGLEAMSSLSGEIVAERLAAMVYLLLD